MNDELQAEAVAPVETENLTDTTNTEPPLESGSAPDTGETPEQKIVFDEDQQKVVDDLMAKKTFKVREAEREGERKLQELQKQLDETKAKIPQDTRPEVPPIPDPYDDDYEVKIQARDEVIRKAAEFDANQRAVAAQEETRTQAEIQKQQEAMNQTISAYADRATKLGVDTQKLAAAEKTIVEFGIDGQITNYILGDDQGPLIAAYLGDNLVELDALSRMTPLQAAVRISSDIKAKAKAAFGVKQPTAPTPVETLNGMGAAPKRAGLKGVTYT